MPSLPLCQVTPLGTVDYQQALDFQVKLTRAVRDGERPNTMLLMDHPPVYTQGRLSQPGHILLAPEELERRGISLCETDRGGQVTFHGPGQLVAYPVVDLRQWGGPLRYVRTLERTIIGTLTDFQLKGRMVEGITGVWVDDRKIAAIGVKISGGVAYHGLAINVNTDLSYFDYIVPCGIEDLQVTSMAQELGQPVDLEMVQYSLAYHFGREMGFQMVEWDDAAAVSSFSQALVSPS